MNIKSGLLIVVTLLKGVALESYCNRGEINNICYRTIDLEYGTYKVLGNVRSSLPVNLTILGVRDLSNSFFSYYNSRNLRSQIIALNINNNTITQKTFVQIQKLEDVQELYLQDDGIRIIHSGDFNKFEKLKILKMERNAINNVEESAFPQSLKKLYLSYNNISAFKCSQLPELEELYLQKNELNMIEKCFFKDNSKLRILNLADNSIVLLTENMFPASLEELFMNNNKIGIFQNNIFPNLKRLDMSNNPFKIFETIQFLSITELNISSSNINLISSENGNIILNKNQNGEILITPNYLRVLDVSQNQIETLDTSVFSKCPLLKHLDFRNNLINSSLDNTQLNELSYVNFRDNSIEFVSPTLFSTSTINYFDFADNLLNNFDFDWLCKSDNNLTFLYLQNNKINALNFLKFTGHQLKILDLSRNQISKIPQNLLNLNNILRIDLSHNKLNESVIRIFLNNSTKLTILNIAFNEINCIAGALCKNCNQLRYIYLNNNKIKTISNSTFSNLAELIRLDLQYNNIQYLPDFVFKDCNNLIQLDLSNNAIMELSHNVFVGLNALMNLNLKNNQINNVIGIFIHLSTLKTLDLSGNHLKVIHYGVFDDLIELNYLNLSHNHLEDVNEFTFTYLEHLNELYIDNNQLSTLNVVYLKTIKKLSLFNNKWNCEDLRMILAKIRELGITIVSDENFMKNPKIKTHTINRIACEKEFININETVNKQLANNSLNDSAILNYLEYFNNTFVYFNNTLVKYSSSIFENKISDNTVYNIIFVAIGLSITGLLVYRFFFVKKYPAGKRTSETLELI